MDDYSNWYQEGYFWIDPSDPWAIRYYGMTANNKFDLAFNTLDKIIRDGDDSEWAYTALHKCFLLLWARKRWPDYMNHDLDPKTKIGWRTRRVLQWLYILGPVMVYGHQRRMSRDPFIAFYTLCVLFDQKKKIEIITMPLHLYRPNTWAWRRYLITGNGLWVYRAFSIFSFSRKEYVSRLSELREIAITNR